MTSEVEERPRLVTASYGLHRSAWVKFQIYSKREMSSNSQFKCNNNDSSNSRYFNQLYFMIKLSSL